MAADTLVAQSLKAKQAFRITGGSLNAGNDLLVVTQGPEAPGHMLLKVSAGRFKDQTPLAVPEGFLYFFTTAANVPDGLLFAGVDSAGSTVLFTTDVTGSRVTRVSRPQGVALPSVFNIEGELWVAGQSEQKSPLIARLNASLEPQHIAKLTQSGSAFTKKVAKQAGAYYVLTQSLGTPGQTVLWKLSPTQAVLAKQALSGLGATFALSDQGIAVSYYKDKAPTVDSFSLDLKPLWSTRVLTPRGTGTAPNVLSVGDHWLVVGGDNDRTYAARLSSGGELLKLTYDQNLPPRTSSVSYVLHPIDNVLWIVGSNIDVNVDSPRNNSIFSYTVDLNSP